MPDTIAAIATPQLPSAIGILRLSGPDTRRILDVVFSPAHGGPISGQAPRRMVLGDLHDRQGRIIDSALAVLFPGPHSYTGEDCAEIHCHGSPVVLNEGLDALFSQGARQAKGGEFTQRAFGSASTSSDLTSWVSGIAISAPSGPKTQAHSSSESSAIVAFTPTA